MPEKQKKNIQHTVVKQEKTNQHTANNNRTGVPVWAPLAIIIFTGLLYTRALNNGYTYIDDDFYILKNQYLRDLSFAGIKAIFTHFYSFNYHPLTTISNLLEFSLFGLNPLPYHLFNVLFHLLNIWLVFKVTERLSGKGLTALIVCTLFAIHPMHVESVAWIAERKDVLYATFYLSATLIYLKYIDSGFNTNNYAWALLLFLCSLLSKSAAVTLPVLLVAIDIYKGRKIDAKAIVEKVPFLLLAILFGILAIMSQKAGGAISDISKSYNFIERVFLLMSGLAAYFIKLVVPYGLSAIHYFPDLHGGPLPWYYYLSLPFLLLITWLVARRSAYRKEVVFGVAFFMISMSVMLQLITVGAAMYAERYSYISYIGLFYIAGQFVADKWESPSANTVMGVCVAFMLLFAIGTWDRIGYWQNTDTLFTDIVEKNPDNWRNSLVYNSWGEAKMYEGNSKDAIDLYSKAVQLKPDYVKAYYNRGMAFDALFDFKSAVADYSKAISLKPKYPEAYNARGWAYFGLRDNNAAIQDYNTAIAMDTKYPEAYNNRGWTRYAMGDTVNALADYDQAVIINPSFAKPYYNRAAIKVNRNDLKGAIADYTTLIKIHPNDNTAYYSRGVALYMMKAPTACNDWRKAAQLGSQDAVSMIQQYCK
ncbi:MAG: hypothetical protein JWQ38_1274 [Flavipsychrobacter sp.]|nr:hypothetical protein [Flavipsychrobacter sp.]